MKFPKRFFRLAGATLLLSLLPFINLQAQQPKQGFSYQAVARNISGSPIIDKALAVRIAIHAGGIDGELTWSEDHDVITSPLGLFTLMVGDPDAKNSGGSVNSFDEIDWSAQPYFLRVWVNADNEFMDMGGSPIQTVPIAQYATSAKNAAGSFSVQPKKDVLPGEALFEVKTKEGQPVFAVYEDMVWVYSDPTQTKGTKGGFAVGGYNRTTKGVTEEYMRITSDSVRLYVNDDPLKGTKGGFAVGGYNRTTKGLSQEYMRITPDSVRVYIDSDPSGKGTKGGFAVGGYNRTTKAAGDDLYHYISGKNSVDVVEEASQIMWYPLKEAFLAGNIHVGSIDSVGQNSTAMGYKSVAMGNYSQAFGYKSMSIGKHSTSFGYKSIARGEDSYALGSASIASNKNAFAIGVGSVASGLSSMALGTFSNAYANYSTSIGYRSEASGRYSHSFGLEAEASGDRSVAIGLVAVAQGDTAISIGSGATASGASSVAIGTGTLASGKLATAIGYQSTAEGYKSISMGAHYYKSFDFILPPIIFPPFFPPFIPPKGGESGLELPKDSDAPKGTFVELPLSANRQNQAVGTYSMSIGNGNRAENGGVALGVFNDAMDTYSTAVGFANQAIAPYSFAGGFANKTEGQYATAFGMYTSAASLNSFTIGTYNVSTGTHDEWIPTDPLFQIGNGATKDETHDAFRVNKNGSTVLRPQNASSGLYNYGVNNTYNINSYSVINADNNSSTVWGIRSYVSSSDPDVSNVYSGRFTGYASNGNYLGLYVDVRSGPGKDVAEYIFDTRADTEPGDVVIADKNNDESVIKSAAIYQTSVLGVISSQPQLIMGLDLVVDEETGETIDGVNATRLALTGRVPVKITEENGPIEPGDLLTTSSTPGHAMKWTLLDVNEAKDFEELKAMLAENEQRRNAVIGKAVSSSSSGEGTVMVLISLQ